MAITQKNLKQHELIGLQVEVVAALNEASVGLKGKVVDETQKTLVIRDASTLKRVFKKGTTFKFKLPDEEVEVEGDEIAFRPWERISK